MFEFFQLLICVDWGIEEENSIDSDSSSAPKILESSNQSYINSISEQTKNGKDYKHNKIILHESITSECKSSTKVRTKIANLRCKRSKQEASSNLKSDMDTLKNLKVDKKHFERNSWNKSSSFIKK